MKLLAHILALCAALALTRADTLVVPAAHHEHPALPGHHHHHDDHGDHDHGPHRCDGLEMDAVTVNEDGVPYFFKGEYLFKGSNEFGELSNQTFSEMDDIHLDHVDAVFRMYSTENPQAHDRLVFFSGNKVFSFYQKKLEAGYPKLMAEDFPGIPDSVDAAVECPEAECGEDTVLFFKGDQMLHFKMKTKTVESKTFDSMPNCSSALRLMEQYYCFQGHMFSKFDPKTGAVHEKYPKETRDYFIKCSNYSDDSDHTERERCSRVHLDAITADGDGNILAFRGHYLIQKNQDNTLKAQLIDDEFKGVHSDVDASFKFHNHHHIFRGSHVYKFKESDHQIEDGYPKLMKDEMGFDGPIDAAFICDDDIAHIIKGPSMISVNMTMNPPTSIIEHPIFSFKKVDGAMWHSGGLKVVVGNHFYNFKDSMDFVTGTSIPEAHKVSEELFGCDH